MNKLYEPVRHGQDLDLGGLLSSISAMFKSNGANLGHSATTNDQNLSDIGFPEGHKAAVPVSSLGHYSIGGQARHPKTLPSSIDEPSRDSRQPTQSWSDHGSMNGSPTQSSVLSHIGDNTYRVVTDRIDDLSPHAGYDDGQPTPSIVRSKRSASEGPSRVNKRRKIEPPPKAPPDHEPSIPFRPARLSEEYEPSCGGRKPKVRPLSEIGEDYYYRQNTSLDDQTYFDDAIGRLRAASYLENPQTFEPTISSEAGRALVEDVRVDGPGCAREDEPVYAIFVDKRSLGPFRCWICGHLEKQRKSLRVLGHVREHFKHRPWVCTEDHGTVRDEEGNSKNRRAKGRHGPW